MKKYLFMAVAAIAALSSCSSDNDLLSGETGKKALTFTATIESDATRATYDSGNKCAQWEAGDQISINGKTYNAQSAGLTTTFKAATPGQEAGEAPYNAYFACTYDGTIATLPAAVSETWADGKFNMPMYATSTTTNLEFKNLCGVLKITVKSDQIDQVKKIRVSSATKAVSGAFTVDVNNAAVLKNPSTVANTLTVTYTAAVPTTEEGVVFYVAVPAQIYQQLKIELSADGTNFTKSMTTKSETNITVARNKIYPITFADNATTGTAAATGIGNVGWVQLWAGGPKFAECNVEGTITFTQATADPFIWGANWCTPSKEDMEHLVTAAKGQTDDKVKCEYVEVNETFGFKFTGKEPGYTDNSVIFPIQNGFESYGIADYWTSTEEEGGKVWLMHLEYPFTSDWGSGWAYNYKEYNLDILVRPVLKE